jgi:hypothetical protein
MGMRHVRYTEIADKRYIARTAPVNKWLILTFWLGAAICGILFLYNEFGNNVSRYWFIGGGALLTLVAYGMATNPSTQNNWPLLIANLRYLYIVDSPDADIFLEIPWSRIISCQRGQAGANRRGIRVAVDTEGLTNSEIERLSGAAYAYVERHTITVAVSTGTLLRRKILSNLRAIAGGVGKHPVTEI